MFYLSCIHSLWLSVESVSLEVQTIFFPRVLFEVWSGELGGLETQYRAPGPQETQA